MHARPVRLTAFKQRALLAALLIEANRSVPVERLIEDVWRERPPEDPAAALQVLVSGLRRALEPGGAPYRLLVTSPGGYELRAAPEEIDATRFAALARAGEFEAALALWRGEALADFAAEPFAQAERGRLEDLRVATLADLGDARLARGEHAALVGDLRVQVERHPLQERFRAQLMLALYRSGRQGEALAAYRAARAASVDALGLEPSASLQQLHAAILAQDPSLELADDMAGARNAAVATAPGSWRRLRWPVAGLAGAALAAVLLLGRDAAPRGEAARGGGGDAVVMLNPASGRVLGRVGVGAGAASVAVAGDAVWVLNADDRTVSRVDPRTRQVVRTLALGEIPTELAATRDALWVGSAARSGTTRSASAWTQAFTRVDPDSGRILARVTLPRPRAPNPRPGHGPGQVLAVTGFGALWAVAPDYSVVRVDERTNRIVVRVPIRASAIAAGPDAIWALAAEGLVRIDPRTNAITARVPVPVDGAMAAGAGAVWIAAPYDSLVLRVTTHGVQKIEVGLGASSIAASAAGAYVGNVLADTVTTLDPETGAVRQVVPVASPQNVAVSPGAVWVTSRPTGLQACGPVVYHGPGRPDRVIVSDLPLQQQGDDGVALRRAADAVAFVVARAGYRAGRWRVGYRSCDDSTAAAASWDLGRCLGNAKGYAAAREVIGVIGPNNSECASLEIPLTNRSPTGAVPIVSGWNTYSGLTAANPLLYPSGVRHYFRVVAQDDAQAAAGAQLAAALGARRVAVVRSFAGTGRDLAEGFLAPARKLGLDVIGPVDYAPSTDLHAVAQRVRRADAIYLGVRFGERGAELVRALRAAAPHAKLIATDIFLGAPDLLRGAGDAAIGLYYTAAGVPDERLPAAGREFLTAFDAGRPPEPEVWPPASHGAAAAEALLAAIAASDGTRPGVIAALHRLRLRHGILGQAAFDARGDARDQVIGVWRVTGHGDVDAPSLRGTVLDRILHVSAT